MKGPFAVCWAPRATQALVMVQHRACILRQGFYMLLLSHAAMRVCICLSHCRPLSSILLSRHTTYTYTGASQ